MRLASEELSIWLSDPRRSTGFREYAAEVELEGPFSALGDFLMEDRSLVAKVAVDFDTK